MSQEAQLRYILITVALVGLALVWLIGSGLMDIWGKLSVSCLAGLPLTTLTIPIGRKLKILLASALVGVGIWFLCLHEGTGWSLVGYIGACAYSAIECAVAQGGLPAARRDPQDRKRPLSREVTRSRDGGEDAGPHGPVSP